MVGTAFQLDHESTKARNGRRFRFRAFSCFACSFLSHRCGYQFPVLPDAYLFRRERTCFNSRQGTNCRWARFNRWLIPPAALAIHLSIGMAYGFSVSGAAREGLRAGRSRCSAGCTRCSSCFSAVGGGSLAAGSGTRDAERACSRRGAGAAVADRGSGRVRASDLAAVVGAGVVAASGWGSGTSRRCRR